MAADKKPTTAPPLYDWAEFLVSCPPFIQATVPALAAQYLASDSYQVKEPVLELFCPKCNGLRFFDITRLGTFSFGTLISLGKWTDFFFYFQCRNCKQTKKSYAIRATITAQSGVGEVIKLGEYPPFGKRVPSRLRELIKKDWDLFFKGWQAEQQGMGIAAFTYYRRVLEDQKIRLLDELIKAAQKLGVSAEVIAKFEAAKSESQFSRAIDTIKDVLPNGLLVSGHNPLTLLYSALSEGVHELSDAECLERARHIVVVLGALADRLDNVTKEHEELQKSISALLPK